MGRLVKTDPAITERAEEELEAIRAEYDEVADQVGKLKDRLDMIERAEEAIDELQMFIQDALADFDEEDDEF